MTGVQQLFRSNIMNGCRFTSNSHQYTNATGLNVSNWILGFDNLRGKEKRIKVKFPFDEKSSWTTCQSNLFLLGYGLRLTIARNFLVSLLSLPLVFFLKWINLAFSVSTLHHSDHYYYNVIRCSPCIIFMCVSSMLVGKFDFNFCFECAKPFIHCVDTPIGIGYFQFENYL